jgi:hypothetical protein
MTDDFNKWTRPPIDWGAVDDELRTILHKNSSVTDGIVAMGEGKDSNYRKLLGDLRALLRKVSGQ